MSILSWSWQQFQIVIHKLAKFEFSRYQRTNYKQWVRVCIIIKETSVICIVYCTNISSAYPSQESITQHHLDQEKPRICKLCVKSTSKCKWGFFLIKINFCKIHPTLGQVWKQQDKSRTLLGYTPKTNIIISNLQIMWFFILSQSINNNNNNQFI